MIRILNREQLRRGFITLSIPGWLGESAAEAEERKNANLLAVVISCLNTKYVLKPKAWRFFSKPHKPALFEALRGRRMSK